MEQWWQQNKVLLDGLNQGEAEDFKSEVQDLTGSIPLLLDKCVVHGKIDLSAEALKMIFNQVQQFMNGIKNDPNITEGTWGR